MLAISRLTAPHNSGHNLAHRDAGGGSRPLLRYRMSARYSGRSALRRASKRRRRSTWGRETSCWHWDIGEAQGRYEQSEPLYERSLSILEKELRPRHPDVAKTLEFYATALQMLGRGAEADELYARAKAITDGRAEGNQEN